MIKKLLLALALTAPASILQLSAQCTIDYTITTPGIYPDSATGLVQGTVGIPYSEVVQARIPLDTVYLGVTVPITNFTIDSITGMPPTFSYACNPGTCIFPGDTNGCILISGTTNIAGTYNLIVYGKANGILFGNPATLPFELDYYKIVINSSAGVPSAPVITFGVSQNEPNPFSMYSNLNFTSPVSGQAELKIYNLIGNQVYRGSYRAIAGTNTIRLDARDLESGVYMYTLTMGQQTITRRMVISKK